MDTKKTAPPRRSDLSHPAKAVLRPASPGPGKVADLISGFERRIDAAERQIDGVLRRQGQPRK